MNAAIKNAAFVFSVLLSTGAAVRGSVVYVDADATGPTHNGASWCAAYLSLSEALDVAGAGDAILVANGRYTPDPTGLADSRDAAFAIPNGVTVEGGYAGCGASDPDQRDLQLFETILSGDLIGDDLPDFGNRGDNVYHVVTTHNVSNTTVLDGLTITAGHADGPNNGPSVESRDQGSGVNNYYGHPMLVDCTLIDNYTANHGAFNDHGGATIEGCSFRDNLSGNVAGGLYMHFDLDTVVTNTEFINNETAVNGGGAYHKGNTTSTFTNCHFEGNVANEGAGMYCDNASQPTITNCTFIGNTATFEPYFGGGGGVYNKSSNPTLTGCTFTGNTAADGGGVYNKNSSPTLINCDFSNNTGEAVSNFYSESPRLTGCTFSGNLNGGLRNYGTGSAIVTDCTFTGNSFGVANNFNTPIFRNCIFAGNTCPRGAGMVNIGASPILIGCSFIDNTATALEGGAFSVFVGYEPIAQPLLINCVFVGNSAPRGGAISANQMVHVTLINCVFNANTATEVGGALLFWYGAEVSIYNSTFVNNDAPIGPAFGFEGWPSTATMTNSIVRGAGEQIGNANDSQVSVSYSNVQGGWGGIGNIDVAPWFADADGADDIPGSLDDDFRLLPGSPGIDAGSNTAVVVDVFDVDNDGDTGEPFPIDVMANPRFMDITENADVGEGAAPIVDMGAYEALGLFLQTAGSRYVSVTPSVISAEDVAIRITSPDYPCLEQYADGDGLLGDSVLYQSVAQWGVVQLHGSELVPETNYEIRLIQPDGSATSPVSVELWLWGDVDNNGVTNLSDVQFIVLGFQGDFSNATLQAMDLDPCVPNGAINLADAFAAVLAFQGVPYSETSCVLPCGVE